jgi:hypothetical protein
MSETIQKNNRQLKSFWIQDGTDFICNLGLMDKAIVVKKFWANGMGGDTFYAIAQASYFPFTDEQYRMRFDNHFDCCELAEKHILDWMESVFNHGLKVTALDSPVESFFGDGGIGDNPFPLDKPRVNC